MKNLVFGIVTTAIAFCSFGQEEPKEEVRDTTRVNFGKTEVLILEPLNDGDSIKCDPKKIRRNEAHWAGIDFGFNVIMNASGGRDFSNNPFLENDIAQSHVWNINLPEHKFKIVKEYFGITTGLGFNFTQVAFDNNYVLNKAGDSTYAVIDTVVNYDKNKLKATYLTLPLFLEFNTHKNNDRGFYLAAGVVGGVRISSRYKRVEKVEGDRNRTLSKGNYNLNPLKLDLMARFGYRDFGGFISYSLTPLFEDGAMADTAYPLTAGLTLNF